MSNASLGISLEHRGNALVAVSPFVKTLGLSILVAILLLNDSNFSSSGAEESSGDWQMLLKAALTASAGLFGISRLMRTRHAILKPGICWITLISLWAFVCVPFALNPTYSFMAIVLMWFVLFYAIALVDVVDPKRILFVIFITLEIYLLACWMAHLAAPELNGFDPDTSHAADAARLGGLSHPNSTASRAVLAIALMLTFFHARMISLRKLAIPFLFTFVTLLFTGSRTWLMASLALMAFTAWHQFNTFMRVLLICGGIAGSSLLGVVLVNQVNNQSIDRMLKGMSRSGETEEIYSMTGRSDLWELCWEKIQESPVFGYGYGCQRFAIEDHFWVTRHAHNLLLNTILGCGYVAGLLLICAFASQILRFFATKEFFPALMIILLIIGGLSENPIFNPMPGTLFTVWLIALAGKFDFKSTDQNTVHSERAGIAPA